MFETKEEKKLILKNGSHFFKIRGVYLNQGTDQGTPDFDLGVNIHWEALSIFIGGI